MLNGTVVTCRDDLVEALRNRKAEIGLSNAFIETALHMTDGGCDKILGPAMIKGLTLPVAFDLLELFGCRLKVEVDPELEARMRDRYERRDERRVRPQKRISKALMERVKPLLFAELGRAGGKARAANIAATLASKIGRKAGRARMRRLTKEQRSALAGLAAKARWARSRKSA
jgi:hypothetical protein